MLTKRVALWVCICCTLFGFHTSKSGAQEISEPPLLINVSGQLYQWSLGEAAPTPVGCDLQGNELHTRFFSLSQSSDGAWAAFNVLPEGLEDGAPTPTGNLWVCNLENGDAYPLTDTNPNTPGLVSFGVFSPDSRQIAWTEISDPIESTTATLMIHDLETHTTSTLVESIPFDKPCGAGSRSPQIIWGEAGIAVGYFITSDMDCGIAIESGISVYNTDGSLLSQFQFEHHGLDLMEWVEIDDEPNLVYQDKIISPHIFSIRFQDGSITEHTEVLEAYVPLADGQTGHYLLSNTWNSTNPSLVYLPNSDTPFQGAIDVAFSPDGSTMALVIGKTVYFGENGQLEPAPWNDDFFPIDLRADIPDLNMGQLEIAWTPPIYRLIESNSAQLICPSVEQQDYTFGGRVVEGLGDNNIRSAPWFNADIIGTIPEGGFVAAVDHLNFSPFRSSPAEICNDGIRWREIIYNDIHGWTAEAQGDTYFLESAG